jgi:hypothetical protein
LLVVEEVDQIEEVAVEQVVLIFNSSFSMFWCNNISYSCRRRWIRWITLASCKRMF